MDITWRLLIASFFCWHVSVFCLKRVHCLENVLYFVELCWVIPVLIQCLYLKLGVMVVILWMNRSTYTSKKWWNRKSPCTSYVCSFWIFVSSYIYLLSQASTYKKTSLLSIAADIYWRFLKNLLIANTNFCVSIIYPLFIYLFIHS